MAVFDYEPLGAKTGIANRALRPLLGLVDPLHVLSMPERVTAFSGYVFLYRVGNYGVMTSRTV